VIAAQATKAASAPVEPPAPARRLMSDSKLSRSPEASREPIPNATIRRWIEIMQPGLLKGDTSNTVVFVLAANGDVIHSEVGYDRGLNDRMVTIAARQAIGARVGAAGIRGDTVIIDSMRTMEARATMRGRISGPGTVTLTRPEARGADSYAVTLSTEHLQFRDGMTNMFPNLDIPSNQIAQVEVRASNSNILDRPLEVIIIWTK
jgi:hypothetical protein